MKKEDLISILEKEDLNVADKVAKILALSDVELSAVKDSAKQKYAEKESQITDLIKENTTLKETYKDYDALKKYKAEKEQEFEKQKKIDFLKSSKVKEKYVDLLLDKIDWEKGTYDNEKKTFSGLDDEIKKTNDSYGDLFEKNDSIVLVHFKGNDEQSDKVPNTSNQRINDFIRRGV